MQCRVHMTLPARAKAGMQREGGPGWQWGHSPRGSPGWVLVLTGEGYRGAGAPEWPGLLSPRKCPPSSPEAVWMNDSPAIINSIVSH